MSFAHLSLSEPEGGPISRFLKLPAPLDTVVFVLKNEQGEIRLPLSFDFGGGSSMGMAEISAKASAAFLRLVTAALRRGSPLRAVVVRDRRGRSWRPDRRPGPDAASTRGWRAAVDFAVGSAHVDSELPPALKAIVKAMAKDPLLELEGTHHFGLGDIERARELANPDGDRGGEAAPVAAAWSATSSLASAVRSPRRPDRTSPWRGSAPLRTRRRLSSRSPANSGRWRPGWTRSAGLLGRNAAGKAERRRRRVALELAQARMERVDGGR